MAEIVAVEAAGRGWTRVRTSDGQSVTLKGTRNWRNNNPGNIEFGPFARSMGAIGTDGRFAVFPSYDAGRQAKASLLFDSPKYNTKTIAGAIKRYAPPTENNTSRYVRAVTNALGLTKDTPLSSLNAGQQARMLDAMQRVEGYRVGRAFDAAGNIVDPSALQSSQTGGIMQAVNGGVPVPQARPLSQSQQTTGIMAAVDPIARGTVTRSDLPSSATAYAAVRNPYDKLREDLLKQKAELEANNRVGGINPFAEPEQPRKYSLAEQYGLYGQGQAAARSLGLLAQDVAAQPSQTYPVNEAVPQSVTAYAPSATTPQVSAVSGPAGAGGLLSPEEQEMFEAQRANLSSQPLNSNLGMKVGNFAKGALGSIGGGLLGSALLGPVGGLIGAAIGNSAMNGSINRGFTGFPEAPKSKSQGDGKETAYGRSVRESSAQYDRAAKSGRAGLY